MPGMQAADYTIEGDLNIGFLVSIHKQIPGDGDNTCSHEFISDAYSFQLSEMMRFAVREVNNRDDILPNVTLGFVVKDICSGDMNALARSVYFLPDHASVCNGTESMPYLSTVENPPIARKVVGIIGPGNDEQAALVASLMTAAQLPVLSTYTSSDELSNGKRFEYFLSLLPPDRAEVRVLMDVARYFGWSYIAVLYTGGSYGEFGYKAIGEIAREYDMYIGYSRQLLGDADDEDHEEIVRGLEIHHQAKVVIAFGDDSHLRSVFK